MADYFFLFYLASLLFSGASRHIFTLSESFFLSFLFFLTELHYAAQSCLKLETPISVSPMQRSQVSDAHLSEALFH